MIRNIFFTFFALLSTTAAYAQSADSVFGTYDIEQIVITSTRTPLKLKDTPVITRIISANDIQKIGAQNIQKVLETELAGVEFHQAGYGASISFQGLDARYVLFLIDGERMAGETYGNIDYSRIPVNDIERIEIIRGASSVLYGSNAMGAVVNIITRLPREKFEVRVTGRYGTPYQKNKDETLNTDYTQDQLDAGLQAKDLDTYRSRLDKPNALGNVSVGVNSGKFRSLTNLTYRSTDAYRLMGTQGEERHYDTLYHWGPKMANGRPVMDESGKMPVFEIKSSTTDTTLTAAPDSRGLSVSGSRDVNVSQLLDFRPSETFRFQISGAYFNKERYDFQTSVMDDSPMSGSIKKPWQYDVYEGYNIKGLMEHSPNERSKIYLTYVRDEYFRRLNILNLPSTPKQRHVINNPRLIWTRNGENHRLTTGLEFLSEGLNFDLNPAGYESLKTLNCTSLYMQDEIFSGRKLSFVAGVRGDYNDRFGANVTPKLSAKYNMGDFAIRANYARGYRTPSIKELYMDFLVPIPGDETYIRGNEHLDPETNNFFSVSGEYSISGFNTSLTVYNSRFHNKIDVVGFREGAKNILRYENVDNSRLSGVELIMSYRPVKGLGVTANYNYAHTVNDAPAGSTQYIYPSPHTAVLQINYDFVYKSYRFGCTYLGRFIGAKKYEDFMTLIEGQTKMSSGTYSSRHSSYTISNFALHAEYNRKINLTFGVDNLFDYRPSVVNFNSAVLPVRNFFVQLGVFI